MPIPHTDGIRATSCELPCATRWFMCLLRMMDTAGMAVMDDAGIRGAPCPANAHRVHSYQDYYSNHADDLVPGACSDHCHTDLPATPFTPVCAFYSSSYPHVSVCLLLAACCRHLLFHAHTLPFLVVIVVLPCITMFLCVCPLTIILCSTPHYLDSAVAHVCYPYPYSYRAAIVVIPRLLTLFTLHIQYWLTLI